MKITKGAVVIGGTSLEYKTGDWRDQRPVINQALCQACGLCEEDCPDGAIRVEENLFSINHDFCKGCGICARECPTEAIQMIPEEK
jgi:pyruvate ferredoxin oxidoreductase delta subunit